MASKTLCLEIAHYFLFHKSTVRKTAQHFGMSKSTIHNQLHKSLKKFDAHLFKKVQKLLDKNNFEKHLRGGEATRKKFATKST